MLHSLFDIFIETHDLPTVFMIIAPVSHVDKFNDVCQDRSGYIKITLRGYRAIVFGEAIVVHTLKQIQGSVERSYLGKRSFLMRQKRRITRC